MAFVSGQTVNIPPVSKGVPPNPLLGYNCSHTATASASESVQSTIAHRVLLYDQRCLVTGAVSTQLQVCYLINPIRIKGSGGEDEASSQEEVESILTRQQFGIGNFSLDSLPNCAALEVQWRGDLDAYGSFCITVPLAQTAAIITKLEISNREWELRATSDSRARRNLNTKEDPFVVKKCVLLVLRPDLFLPEERPLPINTHRVLRVPGGPPLAEPDEPSWTLYYPQRDSPYLIDSSNQEFNEFEYQSKRHPDECLSVFSLLVNANSKLQAAKRRSDYPPALESYIELVKRAVELIFFVPHGLEKQPSSPTSLAPPLGSAQRPDVATPGSSTQSRGREDNLLKEQNPSDVGPRDGGVFEEERSNLGVVFEDYEYRLEEDDEEDEEPGMINGLTSSEMEIVLQRVSDGTIPAQERAEAAMLMLGMAGGHRRPQPISPLLEDYI